MTDDEAYVPKFETTPEHRAVAWRFAYPECKTWSDQRAPGFAHREVERIAVELAEHDRQVAEKAVEENALEYAAQVLDDVAEYGSGGTYYARQLRRVALERASIRSETGEK